MVKLFALIFMTIDHIGMCFFSDCIWFRIVGRLSMPLFAFAIARGWKNTRNQKKYFFSMLSFALISEIPYVFLRELGITSYVNIGFTWVLSLLMLIVIDKGKDHIGYLLFVPLFLASAYVLPINYGCYGVLIPVMIYLIMVHNQKCVYACYTLCALWFVYVIEHKLHGGSVDMVIVQIFALLSYPIMRVFWHRDHLRLPKMLFYWYYPLHLAACCALVAYVQ